MGFWSELAARFTPKRVLGPYVLPRSTDYGLQLSSPYLTRKWTPEQLWKSQPHLRTVVGFRARNTAQLGLHTFRRTADNGRERDRSSVLAQTLKTIDGEMTQYELIFSLVGDLDLYDQAWWFVAPSTQTDSGWMIRRLPPVWVHEVRENPFEIHHYELHAGGKPLVIPKENILKFPGYDPSSNSGASPAVEALTDQLQEQIESAKFREQLWTRGGRVSSVIERPVDADPWSDAAREAFREDWYAKYTGNGSRAGGTPILEDGMKLTRIDFSAQEQQFVEAAKLSLQTVAAAYHVEPTMVGIGDGATYSNMRAFRKMLYTETLGPLLAYIEDRLNTFLVPMLGLGSEYYVEFNIAEKLQGDFEEQASILSTSTGRPWMTANEARSRQNLPALPGGDELVIPLNVLLGGQASPTDSGTQNEVPDPVEEDRPKALVGEAGPALRSRGDGVAVKTRPDQPVVDKHVEVLTAFFARQRRVLKSRKAADWDEERWDSELAADLTKLGIVTATTAARKTLKAAGLDPDDYDEARTEEFLLEASRRNAHNINAVTRAQLDDDEADLDAVFDSAEQVRAPQAAVTLATFAAGFGSVESARQNSSRATKMWVVTSDNPRPSHAAMDGETVSVDEDFSNGLAWPGAAGDVDEVAGCTCDMTIRF